MNRVLMVSAGLLLGAAVGAGVVLLLVPSSGGDMRQQVRDRVQAIVDEGQQAAEARRIELIDRFEMLKQTPAQDSLV